MENLINNLEENRLILIKGKKYKVNTKTWYCIEEDKDACYIKCELSDNKVLVIIPDDNLVYLGQVIKDMEYERIDKEQIKYKNNLFQKTGEGHQFIKEIEFGTEEEIEGKCIFEDYEFGNHIISLGILTDKNNLRADVYADIVEITDIEFER